jgi:hypothetical protein
MMRIRSRVSRRMLPTNLWVPETFSKLNDLLIFVYEAAAPDPSSSTQPAFSWPSVKGKESDSVSAGASNM